MLIIDDPLARPDAEPTADRERAVQRLAEWRREHPNVPILVVIARLHPDDLRHSPAEKD
jgi:hypothetical protein